MKRGVKWILAIVLIILIILIGILVYLRFFIPKMGPGPEDLFNFDGFPKIACNFTTPCENDLSCIKFSELDFPVCVSQEVLNSYECPEGTSGIRTDTLYVQAIDCT